MHINTPLINEGAEKSAIPGILEVIGFDVGNVRFFFFLLEGILEFHA